MSVPLSAVTFSPVCQSRCVYRDFESSVGDGVQKGGAYEGCPGYRLLLRSFDSYGGHCWLVYPRHQAKSFVSCGYVCVRLIS